jgi:TadE-like protein
MWVIFPKRTPFEVDLTYLFNWRRLGRRMRAWLRSSAARRKRGQRGAVAVEAALVTPLLCVLVFGILEFSFVMKDYVAVAAATRTGARIASANPGAGPSVCDVGETASTNCNNSNAPEFAKNAANAIQVQGSALNKDQINYLLVYKADGTGFPGSLTAWSANPRTDCTSAASCVVYTWIKSTNKFTYNQGSWVSSGVSACSTSTLYPGDSVGIYLNATHTYFTGLFGPSVTVSDRTIMKFEPLTADVCAPGTHQ